MNTAAGSKHDIWRCPLLLALPPPRQTDSRAGENVEKQELMCSEHQRGSALTLLSTASRPTWSHHLVPTGAQNGKDGAGPGTQLLQ